MSDPAIFFNIISRGDPLPHQTLGAQPENETINSV
jgi:hypothetical protein